jgi:hypothetical protein
MSKNLYRINKKSDLDEIMKTNFLKPIFLIFVSKSIDKKLYDDIATTLKTLSKQLTYAMILVINFDDFIDNMNFFSQIKENVPYMISYFKAKQIASCNEKDNFIPVMVSSMDQIHSSYVNKLMNAFNQQTNKQDQQVQKEEKQQEIKEENQNKEEIEEPQDKQEEEQEEEEQEEQEEQEEEQEEEEQEQEEQGKEKSKKNNKTFKNEKIQVVDDNTTEEIRLKKEKLKEINRLKEMLNNAK